MYSPFYLYQEPGDREEGNSDKENEVTDSDRYWDRGQHAGSFNDNFGDNRQEKQSFSRPINMRSDSGQNKSSLADRSTNNSEYQFEGNSDLFTKDLDDNGNKLDFRINKESKWYSEKINIAERATIWACEQIQKMQNSIPNGDMKDMINGGCEMVESYINMQLENTVKMGIDNYFHCRGVCQATQKGPAGEMTALTMGTFKEIKDIVFDTIKTNPAEALNNSLEDVRANLKGANAARSGTRCHSACRDLIYKRE